MKQVMVDLDDTLVSFSEMFCDRWNRYIRKQAPYFSGSYMNISLKDITEYDLLKSLNQFYQNNGCKGTHSLSSYFEDCLKEIFSDETFYNNPYLTPEYYNIFRLLKTTYKDDKIILHTKASTYEMMISKANLFKKYSDFDIFDEIIIDMEKGMNHTPKPTFYDVMFDDAPHNIENFLNKNPNGLVYMPVREFNKHLKNNRIIYL